MKKLSLKWKFFLIASYLQLIIYGLFAGVIIFRLPEPGKSGQDRFYVIFFLVVLSLAVLNHLLSVYTVHKYFPDTSNSPKIKILLKISGIINIPVSVLLLIIYVDGLNYQVTSSYSRMGNIGIALFITLLGVWLAGLFTLILQFGVSRYLARNNANRMTSLINSIGKD